LSAVPPPEPPRTPARRKTRRGAIALGILVLWLGALALLARRELFRPKSERFAEAALRINPGAV